MSRRYFGFFLWLALAGGLYFFENNTGTRIVLCCSVLLPLIPLIRRLFFSVDHPETAGRQSVTVQAFSYREEEESGDVRAYQPGDPVNRMHWKLSAKRNEWLIRKNGRETMPEEAKKDRSVPAEGKKAGRGKKRLILILLAVMLFLLLCLLLIPAVCRGAQALCNRLFEASERVNAYAYDRFPVPAEQSAGLAAMFLILLLFCLLGITALSGSRLLALGIMAGCMVCQMYFGLALPGWINVLLFASFALWMMKRPWKPREALILLGAILAVSLTVILICPGVDAAVEAASERVRDALSQTAQPVTGTVREALGEENETRHTHTQSLIQGEREARQEKEYRLEVVEEEQISMPHWISYLKVFLLLLLTIALVIIPFLPFLWLNARRKKALEARAAFVSENISIAVCAIFQQVTAWLEAMGRGAGNVPYRDWAVYLSDGLPPGYARRFSQCAALFEEAAYSDHAMEEAQRQQALSLLDETEQALLAKADWKKKLRLKYGDCLWIEKA